MAPPNKAKTRPPTRRDRASHASTKLHVSQTSTFATVQAYEAQLTYGRKERHNELFAIPKQGESSRSGGVERGSGRARPNTASALIRWGGEEADERELWVDRYDILHLLPSLPLPPTPSTSAQPDRSPSPALTSSSWDSLPSDAEDIWFLSGDEEREEYERGKKRRWLDALREERLREREKEDRDMDLPKDRRGWGGDDEEPPPPILTLMRHTAQSICAAPNPSLLEMRILANHAADERFSFLKGRYKLTWGKIKTKARRMSSGANGEAQTIGLLMGGYGSSDEEESDEVKEENRPDEGGNAIPEGSPPPPPPDDESLPRPVSSPNMMTSEASALPPHDVFGGHKKTDLAEGDEEEKRRLRRARAEEWKRKRRLESGS